MVRDLSFSKCSVSFMWFRNSDVCLRSVTGETDSSGGEEERKEGKVVHCTRGDGK